MPGCSVRLKTLLTLNTIKNIGIGISVFLLCCFAEILFNRYMCYPIQKNQRVQVIVIG